MVRQAGTPNEDNESTFGAYPLGGTHYPTRQLVRDQTSPALVLHTWKYRH